MAKKERKMKLDKNGYQSEKRGSFATAMKVLTLIFGLGVVIAAVCVYAIFSGCGGGGSGNGEPVYDENGQCLKNCSPEECPPCGYFRIIDGEKVCMTDNCINTGDGWVAAADSYYPPGDSCNGDTCAAKPDYIAPPCHVPTDPKIKKMCMPYWAQISKCFSTWDYDVLCGSPEDGLDGKDCYCYGEKAYDPETNSAKSCDTVADCQPIACEEWPHEVCWGLPCLLVGKWDCDGYVNDLTDAEFYDNGDGYCRIHSPTDPSDDLYFKPGDDHVQRPPSGGPIEEKYTVLDGGSQLLGDGSAGTFTCTKMVEEE